MHDLKNKLITQKDGSIDRGLFPTDHSRFQKSIVAQSSELTVHLIRGLLHAEQLLA
jgi:hypothetical protein